MEEKEVKKEKLQMPKDSIDITIGTNEYTIKYPKVGDIIDIERLKITMTAGTNGQMLQGGYFATQAFIYSEAIATFTILVPQLKKDLNVNSLTDLTPKQFKSVSKAYEKYFEWMDKWKQFDLQDE